MQLRLDKWLWYARFCKSRSIAKALCTSGHVTLNGTSVSKASQTVKVGDVLILVQGDWRKALKVLAPGHRRGPASEAQGLYEMLGEPENIHGPKDSSENRARGSGRPTKRDRRAITKLKGH